MSFAKILPLLLFISSLYTVITSYTKYTNLIKRITANGAKKCGIRPIVRFHTQRTYLLHLQMPRFTVSEYFAAIFLVNKQCVRCAFDINISCMSKVCGCYFFEEQVG